MIEEPKDGLELVVQTMTDDAWQALENAMRESAREAMSASAWHDACSLTSLMLSLSFIRRHNK